MAEKKCERCGVEKKVKYLGKIRGELLCKECRRKVRQSRRKETIKESGIGEELKNLDRKIARSYRRKSTKKIEEAPKIKGSTRGKVKQKNKSNCYMTMHEKQDWFRILRKRGLTGDEAKKRINNLIEEQKRIRTEMKDKNKTEEQIKIKQQEMLEDLWKY